MTWVAWRQYRTELLITIAMLAALFSFLIPTGLDRHELFSDSAVNSCLESGRDCFAVRVPVLRSYDSVGNIVPWFNFAPAVVALLLAAPIIVEFEQRTHRLAWTQSITRDQWLAAKFGVALAGVAVFAIALTLVMTWWYAPLDNAELVGTNDVGTSFDFEGAMPLAYTIFALSLALSAGVLSRRMLFAVPVVVVGFVVLRLSITQILRPNVDINIRPGEEALVNEMTRDMERFWTVQAVEAAIFLALSLVLLGLTVWAVRRRA